MSLGLSEPSALLRPGGWRRARQIPGPTAELFLGPRLEDEDVLPDKRQLAPVSSLPALRRMPVQGGKGWTRTRESRR